MSAKTLLLGTRKGLVVYKKKKTGWKFDRDHFLGIPISIAAADPRSGTWWAMQDNGHWGVKLQRSRDQGKTWTEVPAPKYPEGEEVRAGVPATLKYIWAFATGSDTQPGRVYLGTDPGGLFVSDDDGDHFELNRGLWDVPERKEHWFGGGRGDPGIHSIIVDPRNDKHLYIGISCAGVYESKDGGKTWQHRNKGLNSYFMPNPTADVGHDPHRVVMCPGQPDKLWQQNHVSIYRSKDSGASWIDVSQKKGPARFGFAIAVDEYDGDTAWVIPGIKDEYRVAVDHALCVCRTEDGGKTWKTLTKGLPQKATYDLVYRHALTLDGDTLAFGTTTGNLYLSKNRGIKWDCLNNNLPMVYSTQFV